MRSVVDDLVRVLLHRGDGGGVVVRWLVFRSDRALRMSSLIRRGSRTSGDDLDGVLALERRDDLGGGDGDGIVVRRDISRGGMVDMLTEGEKD